MTFEIITIFPEFFSSILAHGILKRAIAGGQIQVRIHDLRHYTDDPHRTVDDRPFGGGPGMVLKPEPLFRAVEAVQAEAGGPEGEGLPVILTSPQGRLLRQPLVEELARLRGLVLICGRYEGVDQRVVDRLATHQISIGDYVLSGGELAAAVLTEACARLVPGVMGNEESRYGESFSSSSGSDLPDTAPAAAVVAPSFGTAGLLDFPHYTRPAEFRGMRVPDVLLSGNHEQIRIWRRREAIANTWRQRPELLEQAALSREERQWLEEIKLDRPVGLAKAN
jgi:tRNA (guanine37-N1)-methyltransferase